jgi:hypothetical protein
MISSMSEAVRVVIDSYPQGHRFYGNQLHDDVAAIFPDARTMYVDTVMRMMRRHCAYLYKNVDRNRSLYERV